MPRTLPIGAPLRRAVASVAEQPAEAQSGPSSDCYSVTVCVAQGSGTNNASLLGLWGLLGVTNATTPTHL
jgi:hypothetical protein